MPWIRVDDHFDEHPKHAQAGPLGWAVWLAGLAYSNRNLTDGFIPWSVARRLVSWEFLGLDDGNPRGRKVYSVSISCGMVGEDVTNEWVIERLVDAGLWEEADGGYYIHDYPEYQPTREHIETERAKKVAAGQAGGQASAQARAQAKSNPKPKPNPVPNTNTKPTTKPEEKHSARSAPVRVSYPDDFEVFWKEYPSGNGSKKSAYEQWRKLKPDEDLRLEIMHGLSLWNRSDRWQRGYVKDSARWLRDQLWTNPPAEQPRASPNGQHLTPQQRRQRDLLAIANGE